MGRAYSEDAAVPVGNGQVSVHQSARLGKGSELNGYVGSPISTSFIGEHLVRPEGGV